MGGNNSTQKREEKIIDDCYKTNIIYDNNSIIKCINDLNNITTDKLKSRALERRKILEDLRDSDIAVQNAESASNSANNASNSANNASRLATLEQARSSRNRAMIANIYDKVKYLEERTRYLENEARNASIGAGDGERIAISSGNRAKLSAEESKYHEYMSLQNELASLESSLESKSYASESEKAALETRESEIKARLNALRTELQKLLTQKNFNDTSELITATHLLGNSVAGHYVASDNLNQLLFNVDQLLSTPDSDSEPFNNIFNNIMTSSFKEGLTNSDTQENLLTKIISNISEFVNNNVQGVNKAIDIRKKFTDTELLMQDDNIMSNMLMDYLINEDEGTNVEKVYNKLNQEAHDKVRKIQINNYQTKLYKEYIFMLKIIIFVSLLIVPLLLLNKLELLSYSITIVIIIVLITLTALFIGHRIILLNSRDSINYDKFRMNFDRENAELLKKTGALYSKKSLLSSLNLTCIGDDCCDVSMSYDNLRNKCILNENFNNIFEEITNVNRNNPNKINVIHQNDLHENKANFSNYEGFITGDKDTEKAKTELFINSLNKTTKDKF